MVTLKGKNLSWLGHFLNRVSVMFCTAQGSSSCSHRNPTFLCLTFWEAQPVPGKDFENIFPGVQGKQNP